MRIALATECAADQGAFWPFHDQVFERRRGGVPMDEYLLQIAADLGLDTNTFSGCLQSEMHLSRITEDGEIAAAYGVRGTPTIFVNGTLVSAFPAEAVIAAVIAAAEEG